jgi:hypothetical protein
VSHRVDRGTGMCSLCGPCTILPFNRTLGPPPSCPDTGQTLPSPTHTGQNPAPTHCINTHSANRCSDHNKQQETIPDAQWRHCVMATQRRAGSTTAQPFCTPAEPSSP